MKRIEINSSKQYSKSSSEARVKDAAFCVSTFLATFLATSSLKDTTTNEPRSLSWGQIRNRYDNQVKPHHGTLSELFESLKKSRQHTKKKNGPGLIASTFRVDLHPDPRSKFRKKGRARWRKTELIEDVHLLMLDVDGASCSLEEALTAWGEHALFHWSTYNHGVPGKGLRVRVVLPLARAVTLEEHRVLYQWALERMEFFGVDNMDAGCRDATRLMYMPGATDPRSQAEPWLELKEGTWLDPDALPDGQSVTELIRKEAKRKAERELIAKTKRQEAAKRRARLRKHGLDATRAQSEASQAERYLELLCDELSALSKARHNEARRIIFRATAACVGTLGDIFVSSRLRQAAAHVFSSRRGGLAELGRLIAGALQKAPRRPWVSAVSHTNSPPQRTQKKAIPDKSDATAQAQKAHDKREQTDLREHTFLQIQEAAEALTEVLPELLQFARAALIVEPGVGKSYAAAIAAIVLAARKGERIVVAVPTNHFKYETLALYQHLAFELGHSKLSIRAVVTRDKNNCSRFFELCDIAKLSPDAIWRFCRACPFNLKNDPKSKCAYQHDKRSELRLADVPCDILITTHTQLLTGDPPKGSTLIIDESPLGAMVHTASWSAHELAVLALREDTKVNDANALLELQRTIHQAKRETQAHGKKLREFLAQRPLELSPDFSQASQAATQAGAQGEHKSEDGTHTFAWRDLEALRTCLERGEGASAFIEKGALHTVQTQALPLSSFEHVLYLDASATETTARTLLGADTEVRRMHVLQSDHVRVCYVPVDLGTNSGIDGTNGAKRQRRFDIWRMLHELTDSPETLHITLKKRRERVLHTKQVLDELKGPVIHHGSDQGQGSNSHQGCDTATVDTWHVPKRATRALALALAELGLQHHFELEEKRWLQEAHWQLTGAKVMQSTERVRTRRASAERPVNIFLTGHVGPLVGDYVYGFKITHVIDPAELAFLAGHFTHREAHIAVKALTAALGGVWAPTLGEGPLDEAKAAQTLAIAGCLTKARLRPFILRTLARFRETPRNHIALRWLRSHHGGEWSRLAAHCGVSFTPLKTASAGRATPILHTRALTPGDVQRVLQRACNQDTAWYRLGEDERVQLSGGLTLCEALSRLESVDVSMSEQIARLMEWMECSRATVYRRLAEQARVGESAQGVVRRLWASSLRTALPEAGVCERADTSKESRDVTLQNSKSKPNKGSPFGGLGGPPPLEPWLASVQDAPWLVCTSPLYVNRDGLLAALSASWMSVDTELELVAFDVAVTLSSALSDVLELFERERYPDESDEAILERLRREAYGKCVRARAQAESERANPDQVVL